MLFKDTIPKPNQIKMIISFVIVALIITLIVIFRKDLYKVKENYSDAEKFHQEYNIVPVNNVFKYILISDANEILKSKSAVLFIGFKQCVWCERYAFLLNEVAKENNIDTIYYLNIYNDRKESTKDYIELVGLLDKYLSVDNSKNKRIYVPDLYVIKDGKIIGHNNDTSKMDSTDIDEYYNLYGVQLKNKLNKLISNLKPKTCNDKSKSC